MYGVWFAIDNLQWTIPCDIKRIPRIEKSGLGGMMLNGVIVNDNIGTYFDYEITVVPNPQDMQTYYDLYEILVSQESDHAFLLPYNDYMIDLRASVENISDVYAEHAQTYYWKGLTFRAVATTPTYREVAGAVIERGTPPLPDIQSPQIGDTYTYRADGWHLVTNN